MIEEDLVRRLLAERGCPDEVIESGLEGLVAAWERVVGEVEAGYSLGLDDYLNDLDGRQLVEEAIDLAEAADREAARARVRAADLRMKALVRPTAECLWGETVAESEGWTPQSNWWYFSLPRAPGAMLREDLEGGEP